MRVLWSRYNYIMANFREDLSPELMEFIRKQHVFFTATAAAEGRINLSPKGMDTFRVFGLNSVGYLDLTGSGNETATHLTHDGRLTIMFCAFEGKPLILRLYGRGSVVNLSDPRFEQLVAHFQQMPGQRQIIMMDVRSVQTSCGFAVPRMQFVDERQMLIDWASGKGDDGVRNYWTKNNTRSIDGLPAPHLG